MKLIKLQFLFRVRNFKGFLIKHAMSFCMGKTWLGHWITRRDFWLLTLFIFHGALRKHYSCVAIWMFICSIPCLINVILYYKTFYKSQRFWKNMNKYIKMAISVRSGWSSWVSIGTGAQYKSMLEWDDCVQDEMFLPATTYFCITMQPTPAHLEIKKS